MSNPSLSLELRHGAAHVNGIRLHYVEAGDGPTVVLLHGFPEFWYAWRHQIPALAAAGYHVVAPDLRGYGRSDKPRGVGSYRLDVLVQDVVALIGHWGSGPVTLVGHDWGGVLAWYAAMRASRALRALVILNAPHPVAYRRELRRPSTQLLRSWYAGLFQLPVLPEALLRARDSALLRRALLEGPAQDAEDLSAYLDAMDAGSLSAALNYYRAATRYPAPAVFKVTAPTLVLWGDRDRFLVPRLADDLGGLVDRPRVEHLSESDHWLHIRDAGTVSQRILRFLQEQSPR